MTQMANQRARHANFPGHKLCVADRPTCGMWPEGAGGGEDTRGSCCVVVLGVVVLTQIIIRTVFDPQVNFVCQKYMEDEVASDQ